MSDPEIVPSFQNSPTTSKPQERKMDLDTDYYRQPVDQQHLTQPVTFSAERQGPYDHRLGSSELCHNVNRGHMKDSHLAVNEDFGLNPSDKMGLSDYQIGQHHDEQKEPKEDAEDDSKRQSIFVTYGTRTRTDPSYASKEVRKNLEFGHMSKDMANGPSPKMNDNLAMQNRNNAGHA